MKLRIKPFVGVILALSLAIGGSMSFINNFAVKAKSSEYLINDQGQTYGHGPYPPGQNQEPDLMLAKGENGVVGYIKSSDLSPSVSSPEEAIAFQKSRDVIGYRSIPLLESDGKTVIGEFRLYSSNGD